MRLLIAIFALAAASSVALAFQRGDVLSGIAAAKDGDDVIVVSTGNSSRSDGAVGLLFWSDSVTEPGSDGFARHRQYPLLRLVRKLCDLVLHGR